MRDFNLIRNKKKDMVAFNNMIKFLVVIIIVLAIAALIKMIPMLGLNTKVGDMPFLLCAFLFWVVFNLLEVAWILVVAWFVWLISAVFGRRRKRW